MARFNLRFLSKSLMRKCEVNLIIPSLDLHGAITNNNPAYYRQRTEKFPLLLLLSGFGDDNEAWLQRSEIIELCDEYRVAAAMIGGENKWFLNRGPVDNWQNFLSTELPDFLFGNFTALDQAVKPIIGGVSMGGYGALYNGLKVPESFSAIFALSPSTKPDGDVDENVFGTLRELFLASREKFPPTYLSVGTNDFIVGPSRELDCWLTENKINLNYKYIDGFGHTWSLWREELPKVMQFLTENKIIKNKNGGNLK